MKKTNKIILIGIMTFISLISIFLYLDKPNESAINSETTYLYIVTNIWSALPALNITHLFIYVFMFYFYYKFYFNEKDRMKKSLIFLSICFALALVFGESFQKTNSWNLVLSGGMQIAKSVVKILGYYFMIYVLIKKLFDFIKYIGNKEFVTKNKYLDFIFDKHPNISITIILILIWLPVTIAFFPGILTWDAINQIAQLELNYHMEVDVKSISNSNALSNHHPILSTLIMDMFINIGKLINNVDVGMYLFILFQLSLLIYVIIYSFKVMRKMNMPNILKLLVLICYAFCPLYHIYALTVVKDVLFTIFMYYYILLVIEILVDNDVLNKKTYILKVIITIFLTMMLRNNGIYTIILSFPILFAVLRKYRKQISIALLVPIILYMILNKVVYPILEISPGSIKEMLSIPFQQTARTLYEGKKYDEQDEEIIGKILDIQQITANYNPILSDPVKNTFDKDATKKELMDYFIVWIKYFFKYPSTYIEATLNNSYGYLDPNKTNLVGNFITPPEFSTRNPNEFNLKHLNDFQDIRNNIEKIYSIAIKTPFIGTFLTPGFYNWLLIILFLYMLLQKNRKFMCVYFALLSILLVCIASPVLDIRYMLTIVYSLPILIMLSIYISKNENQEIIKQKGEENGTKK